jgi:hypothetical protein
MKGYCVPDEILSKAKGYDELENLSSYDLTIHSSIDSIFLTLFDFNKDHLVIESPDKKWTKIFTDLLVRRNYNREIYGQSYNLENFLRGVLHGIIVFGRAFYAVDYFNDSLVGGWVVERIRCLPVETITANYHNGAIKGFTQQYSSKCSFEGVQNYKAEFLPEEVFFTQWIFDDDKGVSPLLSLRDNSQTERKFMNLAQKQFNALSHPDDHSFRTEKARYTSFEKEKKKSETAKLKSISKIGGIIRQPMTDYYDAYYFAKNRKKVASMREYLVEEFNSQILAVLSTKNGLTQPARLKIVDYLSSIEIGKLIDDHKSSKISSKELVDMLAKDMRPTRELSS